ncbi:hypothetical protein SEA_RIKSENGUPTA_10 [Microbacterium phage RikSengupta]|nr:hypothetical protein SEA_RIKSENGUPTA_10 [Microbacterium phage RikSengupta]
MTDDEAQLAKDKLNAAIKEYYDAVEPEVYVDDWVLVVHKDSIDLTSSGLSAVSTLIPTGQAFHRTTGLLGLAYKASVDF